MTDVRDLSCPFLPTMVFSLMSDIIKQKTGFSYIYSEQLLELWSSGLSCCAVTRLYSIITHKATVKTFTDMKISDHT